MPDSGQWYGCLGNVVEACYQDALARWRQDYAPAVAVPDLFANHLRSATFACKAFPDGVHTIMVRVLPRRPSEGEVYFWKVLQTSGRYYVV